MVIHHPDSDVLLGSIRDKARATLLVKGIDLRALMEGAEGGPSSGRIVERRFFAVLEKVGGMVLDEEEKGYVIRRFANHRRVVNYAKFYHAVDIYLPRSHSEPDHFIDPLPQPYRRIMKVLEEDILERAWQLIGQKHPEVMHTLYAEQIDLFKVDMQRECEPSSWVEDELGTVTALAMDSATSSLFVGTLTGRVLLVNTDIGRISSTLAPFSDAVGGIRGLALSGLITPTPPAAASDSLDLPAPSLIVAAFINVDTSQPQKPLDVPPPSSSKQDKKKKEPEAPPPEPPAVARLALLHVSGQTARAFASLQSKVPIHSAVLSRDGAYLAVTTIDGGLSVHKVPPSDTMAEGELTSNVSMAKIAEMDEIVFRVSDKLVDIPHPFFTLAPPEPPPPFPSSVTVPSTGETNTEDSAPTPSPDKASLPKPLLTLHFLVAEPAPSLSPLDLTGRRLVRRSPVTSGLLIWRAGSDRLQRYDFVKAATPPPPPEPPADAKKRRNSAAAPDPAAAAAAPPPSDVAAVPTGEVVLPAPITATCLDPSTYLLILGLHSGAVLFWDLHVGGFREALGRHEGPVTAVGLSHNRFVISGAAHGRVHVYDLSPDASTQETGTSSEMRELYGLRVPRLLGYRDDLKTSVVAIHTFDDVPLALVQDAESTLCVFDLLNAVPLGKLCKPPGLDFLLRSDVFPIDTAAPSSSPLQPPPPSEQSAAPGPSDVSVAIAGPSNPAPPPEVLLGLASGMVTAAYVPKPASQQQQQQQQQQDIVTVSQAPSGAGGPVDAVAADKGDGDKVNAPGSDNKTRLALFSTVQLIRGLCPAIASLGDAVEHTEMSSLFHIMPPDVRRQPQAPPEYANRFLAPASQVGVGTKSVGGSSSRRSPTRHHHNNSHHNLGGSSFRSHGSSNSLRSPSARTPHAGAKTPSVVAGLSPDHLRQPSNTVAASTTITSSSHGGGGGSSPKGPRRIFSFSSSSDVRLKKGPGGRSPSSSGRNSSKQPGGGTGLGALTKENLSILFGGSGVDLVKGVQGCRYLDPEEAVNRLKASRNANKEDRDGRVMDALQDIMARLA